MKLSYNSIFFLKFTAFSLPKILEKTSMVIDISQKKILLEKITTEKEDL